MIKFLEVNDWLGHIVEAICIAAFVGMVSMLLLPSWQLAASCGLYFAAGHFHGREKRDYEVKTSMPPPHLKGYYMWRWSKDNLTDFIPAAAVVLTIAAIVAQG